MWIRPSKPSAHVTICCCESPLLTKGLSSEGQEGTPFLRQRSMCTHVPAHHMQAICTPPVHTHTNAHLHVHTYIICTHPCTHTHMCISGHEAATVFQLPLYTQESWTSLYGKSAFLCHSIWEWVRKLGVSAQTLFSKVHFKHPLDVKGEADSNCLKMRAKRDHGTAFKMSFMRPLRPKPVLKRVCFGWPGPVLRN